MKKRKLKSPKKMIHIITFFISIISIFLFKITYISILLALTSLILSIIFFKKHPKILIITLLISIIMIIINFLVIYNNIEKKIDVYKDQNILLGSWTYNEYGGTYIFKEDYTYIQYSNSSTEDNFCKGTYNYTYGASDNNGIIIRQDDNYYYYTLILKEKNCQIMNKVIYDEYTKNMVFSINKYQENEIIMMNKENENIFTMTKN